MSNNHMAMRRQLAAAAAMIEATRDVVEIGAPEGIETVLALAALDEAAGDGSAARAEGRVLMPYPSPADEPDALDALLAPLCLVVILASVALAAAVWLFDRVRGAVRRLRAAWRR